MVFEDAAEVLEEGAALDEAEEFLCVCVCVCVCEGDRKVGSVCVGVCM